VDYGKRGSGGVHVSSNAHVSFGAASDTIFDFSGANPALPAIHVGAADRSLRALYAGPVSGCYR
jgi:hypothetical protein